MHECRGWVCVEWSSDGYIISEGWWTKKGWSFMLKFTARAEKDMFFRRVFPGELRLQDAVQYVTHVKRSYNSIGNVGIEVLFDALDFSKPSRLETIDVDLNSAEAAGLDYAIKCGCLQSLKHLRSPLGRSRNYGYWPLLTLADAISSHGLPSLETLFLTGVDLDLTGLKAYGIVLASGTLPSLSRFHISGYINEGVKSVMLAAIRSSNFTNWAIGITDKGLTVLVNASQDSVASLFSSLRSLDIGLHSPGNLTFLDVSGHDIGDEGALPLQVAIRSCELKYLSELRLNKTGLTDEGLIALVDCFQEAVSRRILLPNLRSLDIGFNSFTEVGMSSLSHALISGKLPDLSCLDISGNNIGDEAVHCLRIAIWSGELRKLAELRLNKIGLSDEGLIALVNIFLEGVGNLLPSVRFLKLGDNTVTKAVSLPLSEALASGKLQKPRCFNNSENAFIRNKGLKSAMKASNAMRSGKFRNLALGITNEGVSAVMGSFQHLNVASVLQDLSSGNLHELIALDISGNDIGDELADCLALEIRSGKLKNLAELSLNIIGPTDEGLIVLTEAGLLSLAQAFASGNLPKPSCLRISGNAFIRDEGVKSIGHAIRSGNLENWAIGITNEGVSMIAVQEPFQQNLASVLQDLSSGNLHELIALDISGNDIGDELADCLALEIRSGKLKNLAELSLNLIGPTDEGLIVLTEAGLLSLAQAFASGNLPKPSCLRISGNAFIRDEGVKSIGHAIRSGNLKTWAVGITNEGVSMIAVQEPFQQNLASVLQDLSSGNLHELIALDIAGNDIGDELADCLALKIRSGELKNLAELSLNIIGPTDEGLIVLTEAGLLSLAQAFASGNLPKLSCLRISGNVFIRNEGVKYIGHPIRSGNLKNWALGSTNEGVSMIAVQEPFQQNLASVLQDLSSGNLHELIALDISGNDIGDELADCLALKIRSGELKNLAELSLNIIGPTDEGLIVLTEAGLLSLAQAFASGNLPKLSCLRISGNVFIRNEGVKYIGHPIRSGNLKNWALGSTNEGVSMIAVQEPFQQNLAGVLQDLSSGNLHELIALNISGNDIGDEVADCLALEIRSGELKNLAELSLNIIGPSRPTDEGLIVLTEAGLLSLAQAFASGNLPKPSCLRISGNAFIRGEDVKSIGHAIRSGNLKNWAVGITNEGVRMIAVQEPSPENLASVFEDFTRSGNLHELIALDISGNDVGDKVADCLELEIRSGELKNLAELSLNKTGHPDNGLIALTEAALLSLAQAFGSGKSPELSCLRISGNAFIRNEGVKSIGQSIRSGNLKNWAVGITNEGVNMIAVQEPFQQNLASVLQDLSSGNLHELLCLDISGNDIGDEGAKYLGRAVQSRKLEKLVHFRLSEVGLTDEGLKALVDSFQEGLASLFPNLGFLDLTSNPFTETGMFSLGEALKSGHLNSLEVLAVRRSAAPSKEGARALVSALLSNSFLTLDVEFEWYKFPELDRRRRQLILRNSKNRDILAGLTFVPNVQATFAKVYLCGNPEVGKTTLCRSLQRSFWTSLITWERKPHSEKRTRGIVVSRLSSKANKPHDNPITLLVWDMAGQEDFHLIHNAFFPDLGFAEGKATTFIIVCSSKDSPDKSMEQLEYWLRYIASSCDKTVRNPRQVFVVMNKFAGARKIRSDAQQYWKMVLEGKRDKFKQHLEIQTELSLVDVRRFKQVHGLRSCLVKHSRNLLTNQEVPDICQAIEQNLSVLCQQREQFPVLHWTEFVEQVDDLVQEGWPEHIIEAATKYLNEAGVVIYIDMEGIRLVVVDPTWLCREIIGKVFLPWDMASPTEDLFRKQVNQSTGSISISDFKKFFKSLSGEWNGAQVDHLIAILLWLGLCYKGKDNNIFLPALIAERGTPGNSWSLPPTVLQGRDQWVMGFSVRHQKNEVALAPISLWHRFQVDLAQFPKFNGERPDNDFVAAKYFVTFVVDHMNVLIEVDASLEKPTFKEISILVKPRSERKDLDATERKQCQVDLANDLVERLLNLWNKVCPGVEYEQRVIWPWPASSARPPDKPERNVEVAEVKKWVQERGVGTEMYWTVGIRDPITEGQLLSTRDKIDVVQSVEHTLSVVTQGMKEAVSLGIFPPDVLTNDVCSNESVLVADGIDIPTTSTEEFLELDESDTKLNKLLSMKLKPVLYKMDKMYKKLGNVENLVREGFGEVLNKQKVLLQKLQDTEKMFLENGQSICPKFIYLRTSDSAWVSLKDALSLSKTVRLHFACEAGYDNYRPHADVENQQGLDVSQLTDWGRTVLPWLKVSLTVLFISAKVAANVVAPGLGLIFPSFVDWKQTTTLLDGLVSATGLSKDELEQKIEGTGFDVNDANGDPQGLYKKSRKAISELLGKLTHKEFEEKIGLRKVRLEYHDGSLHGVVWICTACLEKFPTEMVSEL